MDILKFMTSNRNNPFGIYEKQFWGPDNLIQSIKWAVLNFQIPMNMWPLLGNGPSN